MPEDDNGLTGDHDRVVITIRDAELRPIITVRLTRELTEESDEPGSPKRESPARS
jgi:hypothetical protein